MSLGTDGNPEKRLPVDRQPVVRGRLTLGIGTGRIQEPGREGGADHLTQRVKVVGSGPAEKFQFVGSQERFRVKHFYDRFQLLRGFNRTEHDPDHPASTEGNQYPFAGRDLRSKLRWNKVMKGGVKMEGNGYVDGRHGVRSEV
jgi:hypothetical protein